MGNLGGWGVAAKRSSTIFFLRVAVYQHHYVKEEHETHVNTVHETHANALFKYRYIIQLSLFGVTGMTHH